MSRFERSMDIIVNSTPDYGPPWKAITFQLMGDLEEFVIRNVGIQVLLSTYEQKCSSSFYCLFEHCILLHFSLLLAVKFEDCRYYKVR